MQAKDLLKKMLTLNPDERISASEAYAHPWIQENFYVEHLVSTVKKLEKFTENDI